MDPAVDTAAASSSVLELSPTFTKLFSALAIAQGQFPPIEMDKTAHVRSDKGNYDFDYASLQANLAAVRPVLSRNGLALVQPWVNDEAGVTVQTWLVHGESGEWMRTKPCRIPGARDVKAVGTVVTYVRRYHLGPVLGVAAEEDVDDGQDTGPRQERRAPPPPDQRQQGARFTCRHGHPHTSADGAKNCQDAPEAREKVAELPGVDRTLEPGKDPAAMAPPAPPAPKVEPDAAAMCRKAIDTKAWNLFLTNLSAVSGDQRAQLQREYQAARYPKKEAVA